MKKIIIFALLPLFALGGCNYTLDFDFAVSRPPADDNGGGGGGGNVDPDNPYNILDGSAASITAMENQSVLNPAWEVKNAFGDGALAYFNMPTYEFLPVEGDSTKVNVTGELVRFTTKFTVDSNDQTFVDPMSRYAYAGPMSSCEMQLSLEGQWDETEEILSDIILSGYTANCERECELDASQCPAKNPQFDLIMNYAFIAVIKQIEMLDDELDLTIVGSEFADNEVSAQILFRDVTDTSTIEVPPVGLQHQFTFKFDPQL